MVHLSRIAATGLLLVASVHAQDQAYICTSGSGSTTLFGVDLGRPSVRLLGTVSALSPLSDAASIAWRATSHELWSYDRFDRQVGIVFPASLAFQPRSVSPVLDYVTDICWNPANDRILLLQSEAGIRRWTLTSFSPSSGAYSTVASWTSPPGLPGFTDISCDAAGNTWLLGGMPYGLHVLEPGAVEPRWVTAVASSSGLAIERVSGSFYLLTGPGCTTLGIVDPATGTIRARGTLLGCTQGFEVIEGSCNPRIESYGTTCAGSGGYAPILSATGCYNASGFVHLGLSQAPSGSVALLLFGLSPASFPLGNGCELQITPVFTSPQIALPLFGSGGAGRGFTAIGLSIPAGVVTTSLVTQAFVLDPGALGGFTMTNGVRLD